MTIAIVIGTHGWAAEQLLKNRRNAVGRAGKTLAGSISFPGEKCRNADRKVQCTAGKNWIPQKACCSSLIRGAVVHLTRQAALLLIKKNYEVIAGVNVPMLVETFMARDDDPSFDELVALAVETGSEGVKALKAKPVEKAAPVQAAAPKAATPAKTDGSK